MANKFQQFAQSIATLASTIKHGIKEQLKEVHTHLPGIIESFDPQSQTVTVQPAIRRIIKSTDGETVTLIEKDLPKLINVPVIMPRGGGFSISFNINKGDECLLIFCERSIDNWFKFGGVKKPLAKRFHDLSDAVAYVGLSSLPNVIPNYHESGIEIKKDDGSVSIKLNDDGTIELLATTLNIISDVNITGDVSTTGTLTNNGTDVGSTHTHTQGNDSGGNTEQNTGTPI